MRTLAEMKRTLTPGARVHIENHIRPVATRDTVVLPETNTVDLVTHAVNDAGVEVKSHMAWPPAAALRPNEDGSLTILSYAKRRGGAEVSDNPFITIRLLSVDA